MSSLVKGTLQSWFYGSCLILWTGHNSGTWVQTRLLRKQFIINTGISKWVGMYFGRHIASITYAHPHTTRNLHIWQGEQKIIMQKSCCYTLKNWMSFGFKHFITKSACLTKRVEVCCIWTRQQFTNSFKIHPQKSPFSLNGFGRTLLSSCHYLKNYKLLFTCN